MPSLSVSVDELLAELKLARGLSIRKQGIPVLSCVKLDSNGGPGGTVRLTVTNLDVSLTSDLKQEGILAGDPRLIVLAPLAKLADVVAGMPRPGVLLSLDGDKLTVGEAGARVRFQTLAAEDFPDVRPLPGAPKLVVDPQSLRRLIALTSFAIPRIADGRYYLSGALLAGKSGRLEMVATDGHRLAAASVPFEGVTDGLRVLIPTGALDLLDRVAHGTALEMRETFDHVSFDCGPRGVISRKIDGAFPDYSKIVGNVGDKVATFGRLNLISAIKRALIIAERTPAVQLKLSEGALTVTSADPNTGDTETLVPVKYSGAEIVVGFNGHYILDFLNAIDTEDATLSLTDTESHGTLRPVGLEGAEYVYVVMPMRI